MTALIRNWWAQISAPPASAVRELAILLVDDQVGAGLYADHVLRRLGYQPVVATSGSEAVEKAMAMPRVDVLVTDLVMPGLNGDELAANLRQRDAELKVLYLTGFSDDAFAAKVAARGSDALLEKPFSGTALEDAFSLLAYGHLGGPAPSPTHAAPALWV